MDKLIAKFKDVDKNFAFHGDAPLPGTCPRSAALAGPAWQSKTATRLEATYWRANLWLLSR